MNIRGDYETVGGLLFTLLLSLIVFGIAKKNNFFSLHTPEIQREGSFKEKSPVSFWHVVSLFAIYTLLTFLILPLFFVLVAYLVTGDIKQVENLSSFWSGWLQLMIICLLFVALISYCYLIHANVRHFVFWGNGRASWRRFWKASGMGIVAWLVGYPIVLFVSVIAHWVAQKIWGITQVEQDAVVQLKSTMSDSLLFAFMVFAVALLVPFMEELLFRGFLQNYLKRHLGRKWAIGLTALLFAIVHYSNNQGHGNLQLITSLFILALFLGFIYEREQSLWASVALHATFNSFTIAMIILGIS